VTKRVFVCPGHHHGAQGAGNAQYGHTEHQLATRIVTLVEHVLHSHGVEVLVSNGNLRDKIDQINRVHAHRAVDLALDIHFNADADHLDPHDYDDSRGDGCMVMYNPGNQQRATQAARFSRVMAGAMGEVDRGGRPGWYWGRLDKKGSPIYADGFVRKTNCPALIPEPGYIDNNGFVERVVLAESQAGWVGMAEAIAKATLDFLGVEMRAGYVD
jgi:N-acetylmuramoyl-L-alanine amidase